MIKISHKISALYVTSCKNCTEYQWYIYVQSTVICFIFLAYESKDKKPMPSASYIMGLVFSITYTLQSRFLGTQDIKHKRHFKESLDPSNTQVFKE